MCLRIKEYRLMGSLNNSDLIDLIEKGPGICFSLLLIGTGGWHLKSLANIFVCVTVSFDWPTETRRTPSSRLTISQLLAESCHGCSMHAVIVNETLSCSFYFTFTVMIFVNVYSTKHWRLSHTSTQTFGPWKMFQWSYVCMATYPFLLTKTFRSSS